MKKYLLGLTIISSLFTASVGLAMEKEKKQMPQTSLSEKQVTELRTAITNYKNAKFPTKNEQIINEYRDKYPNDPFVKAKINEKTRFDNSEEPAKKSKIKKTPPVQQSIREEKKPAKQITDGESNIRITNRESKTIEIETYYNPGAGSITKIIEPQETVLISMPEANQRDLIVNVHILDASGERDYEGYSDIFNKRIKKGELLDLVYENDRQYYPSVKVGPGEYVKGKKTASHLHEVGK